MSRDIAIYGEKFHVSEGVAAFSWGDIVPAIFNDVHAVEWTGALSDAFAPNDRLESARRSPILTPTRERVLRLHFLNPV